MWKRFNPLDELDSLFLSFEPTVLPAQTGTTVPETSASWWTNYPAVESFRRGDTIVLRAELPGVDPKDLDMTVDKGRLIIKGEKREDRREDEKDVYLREIFHGRFQRSFTLPRGIKAEQVQAGFNNGVLEVSFPAQALEDASTKVSIQITDGETKEDAA